MEEVINENEVKDSKEIRKNYKIATFVSKYYWYIFAFGILLVAFLSFFKLGSTAVDPWDEARHGINAFEMMANHNYIANYYNGSLDYYNLKPPISYYFIMIGYKIFGYNAWGLRFFSALSYVALVVIVALFIKKHFNKTASLISIFMFAGCYIFYLLHFVRTGDADALFVLEIGVAIISIYLSSQNPSWYFLTGGMLALAFLTKSYHAIILLPIIFFYYIFTKQYKIVQWWQYGGAILMAVLPILLWAFFRFGVDGTTFFHEMLYTDVLNRTSTVMESHKGYPFYYTINLFANAPLGLCTILLVWNIIKKLRKKESLSNLDILCLVSFISIMLLFGITKTKLNWYTYPLCTPLIIYGSVTIYNFVYSDFKEVLKKIIYITSTIIILGSAIAGIYVSAFHLPNKQNELQQFITTLSLNKTDTVYFYCDGLETPVQDTLMVYEWQTSGLLKEGGLEKFKTTHNAYIIINKNALDNLSAYQIITQQGNYMLCYNP